jgi:glycerol uptake facilitator protein
LYIPLTRLLALHTCARRSVGFIAAVGGEFVGAFVGAVLVWLHFLPHFKTIPEPPAEDPADLLLRSRDAPTPTALGIAS